MDQAAAPRAAPLLSGPHHRPGFSLRKLAYTLVVGDVQLPVLLTSVRTMGVVQEMQTPASAAAHRCWARQECPITRRMFDVASG
jgi:hypothetical protein